MFGWEFPPHISGGLGTACYGLTKGLYTVGDVEILFVVPKAFGDEDHKIVRLIGANEISLGSSIRNYESFLRKISFIEIKSNILPYATPEEYEAAIDFARSEGKELVYTKMGQKFDFSGGYGANLFQEISNYAVVAGQIASQFDFDIIHAHDWLTYPAGMAAKAVSGKPLVVHVHATDFDRSGGSVNPGVYDIERRGMHAADKVITVSNLTKNIVINNYGIDPEKVTTVYNAVEPSKTIETLKAEKGINDKIVTFLGRVTLQKGPEYFIEAAYSVLQKMSNVRFVMAGSGELLTRMIHRVAALKIGDRVHFTGFLKGDQVQEMFDLSDVYVMPSVSEPFGISPLEAMQSNVPVIISRQSGVSEILQNAIKLDFWDIDAMADAIYGILNYPGLEKHFRQHGKEEVNNLKWDSAATHVKEIYQTLI
ncbi:MAG: glycosyltransferase family 4 protein [Bacteroidales bacterium]|nr:glycosyltransferase family 4 protein [Bacteroidales bacterium]MBN2818763.1 glycosyltransferase family 4 protein [Bacteroidales bacterium]